MKDCKVVARLCQNPPYGDSLTFRQIVFKGRLSNIYVGMSQKLDAIYHLQQNRMMLVITVMVFKKRECKLFYTKLSWP